MSEVISGDVTRIYETSLTRKTRRNATVLIIVLSVALVTFVLFAITMQKNNRELHSKLNQFMTSDATNKEKTVQIGKEFKECKGNLIKAIELSKTEPRPIQENFNETIAALLQHYSKSSFKEEYAGLNYAKKSLDKVRAELDEARTELAQTQKAFEEEQAKVILALEISEEQDDSLKKSEETVRILKEKVESLELQLSEKEAALKKKLVKIVDLTMQEVEGITRIRAERDEAREMILEMLRKKGKRIGAWGSPVQIQETLPEKLPQEIPSSPY